MLVMAGVGFAQSATATGSWFVVQKTAMSEGGSVGFSSASTASKNENDGLPWSTTGPGSGGVVPGGGVDGEGEPVGAGSCPVPGWPGSPSPELPQAATTPTRRIPKPSAVVRTM